MRFSEWVDGEINWRMADREPLSMREIYERARERFDDNKISLMLIEDTIAEGLPDEYARMQARKRTPYDA